MSASFPDWTWVACCPLPHCWKMSGGALPRSAGVILVLNSSFCIGTLWIVMFGCAASNCLMTLLNTPSRGCVLALFHQLSVTLAALPLADAPELLDPPLLHAASTRPVAAATATAKTARFLYMCSPQGVAARGRSESLGRLSMCRYRRIGSTARSTPGFHSVTYFLPNLLSRFFDTRRTVP